MTQQNTTNLDARLAFEPLIRRLRLFGTNGDELALQNAADSVGVKIEFGGIPGRCLMPPLKMERRDEEGNKDRPTEWFVAYVYVQTVVQVERVYLAFMGMIGQKPDLQEFRNWLSRA